jgi:hypothetical protein
MIWPIFKSKNELLNSKWKRYFISLYGEVPNIGYPIDIGSFWLLYLDLLKKANIKLEDNCIVNDNYDKCYKICPKNEGQLYTSMSEADDMEKTIWIYHKKPYKPLPNNTYIEVTHVSGGYTGQKQIEAVGSWMYYAKGSGVYFNTGNTISFKNHSDSVKYFLNISISCPIYEECVRFFSKVFETAKQKGYDSIQYLNHDDMRCGNTAIEIVDLYGIGSYPCGNKTKLNIKYGWNGTKLCKCNNTKQSMNCLVNNKMIGGYDALSFKKEIINSTFIEYIKAYLQYIYYHKRSYNIILILLLLLIFGFISISYIIKNKKNIYIIYLISMYIIIIYLLYMLF